MNISPINSFYKTNNITKQQNFNGLWGKETKHSDQDLALGVLKVERTNYYYPFIDESVHQIDQIINDNSDATFNDDDPPKYIVRQCRLGRTLPFTESQFKEYKKATESNSDLLDIHAQVKNLYSNSAFDSIQESVVNKNFNC